MGEMHALGLQIFGIDLMELPLGIGLTGAEPHIAQQEVLEKDFPILLPALIGCPQLVGATCWQRGHAQAPAPITGRSYLGEISSQFYLDEGVWLCPSPDGERDVALEDGMILKNGSEGKGWHIGGGD